MTTNIRIGIAGIALVAGFGFIYMSSPTQAAQEKDIKVAVQKIADAIKKDDKDGAKKLAAATAKDKALVDDLIDVMRMFKLRKKLGLGVGAQPLQNEAKDGIEAAIRELAKGPPGGFAKNLPAYEEMGYHIAALGELSAAGIAHAPIGAGKKNKKAWADMSEEMRVAGLAFAKAAAGKNAKNIQDAASKVNENCNKCHSIFKD